MIEQLLLIAGVAVTMVVLGVSCRGLFSGGKDRMSVADFIGEISGNADGIASDIASLKRDLTRRINNIGCISFPGFERFEAWTQCPTCDQVAVHQMRQPLAKPVRGPVRTLVRDDGTVDKIWAFNGMSAAGPDESVYDTIRVCDCGQEWGQR